jgi:hypothetical protein
MKKIVFIGLFLLAGCTADSDTSEKNYKRGNEYFDKKEYEIAEYYYEKVPEGTVFYAQAQKKILQITEIKRVPELTVEEKVDITKITIIGQSFTIDYTGRVPTHRISIVNGTPRHLGSIILEITYLDASEKISGVLTTEVETPMFAKTQDVFKGIKPGIVKEPFTHCKIRITSARFED